MEVSRATCHATSSAPHVHLRHRVVRAFDGTHTITCAQRQQQLRRLLAMKDGVRRPVTLMDRRGLPLDARSADSSPARGSADASSRIRSRDPAAADLWSAAAGRCLWRPASSLEPAQVVDGRLYGWSGPRRRPARRRGVHGRAHALPMCSTNRYAAKRDDAASLVPSPSAASVPAASPLMTPLKTCLRRCRPRCAMPPSRSCMACTTSHATHHTHHRRSPQEQQAMTTL